MGRGLVGPAPGGRDSAEASARKSALIASFFRRAFNRGNQMDRSTLSLTDGFSCVMAALVLAMLLSIPGCREPVRDDLSYDYDVYQLVQTPELEGMDLVQFDSVFWEPDDTVSLRGLIFEDQICTGRSVLEIGTGTGLISLVCLQHGADSVVATDINPAAVANARYNAAIHELDENFEVRLVDPESPGAFSVIGPGERFDLILSNPPWEDGSVSKPAEHALYDPGFALMDSLLEGLPRHLNPGGRCLLAYGHTPAISRLLEKADAMGFKTKLLDDRKLEDLPTDFLPGMLIEIRLGPGQIPKVKAKQPGDSVKQVGDSAGQKAGERERETDDSVPQNRRRDDSKVKSNLGGETSKTDD